MYWNYRIVSIEDGFGLYEVYYEDKTDKPFMRTEDYFVWGEDRQEIIDQLEKMLSDAMKQEILDDSLITEENELE